MAKERNMLARGQRQKSYLTNTELIEAIRVKDISQLLLPGKNGKLHLDEIVKILHPELYLPINSQEGR